MKFSIILLDEIEPKLKLQKKSDLNPELHLNLIRRRSRSRIEDFCKNAIL